jgi:hypothetical protein
MVVYKILLERQKMNAFNRFFLLASLFLSIGIPWITLPTQAPNKTITNAIIIENAREQVNALSSPIHANVVPVNAADWQAIVRWCDFAVSTILLLRFSINLYRMVSKIIDNEKIAFQNLTFVLINERSVSYSFFNFIFINKVDYYNDAIEPEILQHEACHAKQLHSLDIVLIELLQVFFWFNPVLLFYKRAIQLNHEFLADETVLKNNNLHRYQHLLIAKASTNQYAVLASQFNYLTTKKRLLMMTKTTSVKKASCIQMAVVPTLACAIFLFSTRAVAQEATTKSNDKLKKVRPKATTEGASEEWLAEYETLSVKAKTAKGRIPEDEYARLQSIFTAMSKEQQEKQSVLFIKLPPLGKNVPTEEEFESLKDPKKYGVWLDDKKIENRELDKYKNTDFSNFGASILMKNARRNVDYTFQANLMTNKYYDEYIKKELSNKRLTMMIKK